jgi:hypothetical protein
VIALAIDIGLIRKTDEKPEACKERGRQLALTRTRRFAVVCA